MKPVRLSERRAGRLRYVLPLGSRAILRISFTFNKKGGSASLQAALSQRLCGPSVL